MKIPFVKIQDINIPVRCLFWHKRRVEGVYSEKYTTLYHPCGKCYLCRKRLASQWAFRCNAEAEDRFVYNMKFTYSDEKLPFYKGKPSLNRQQLQDAFKRFRYYLDKYHKFKIRFFANGEYSPELERPHYHAILFSSVELEELSDKGKTLEWLNGKFERGQRITDGYFAKIWPYGIASINRYDTNRGSVGAMVGYMVNYMFTQKPQSAYDDFNKPFRMISRGIGDRFALRHPRVIPNCKKRKLYTYDVPVPHGTIEVAYPRYYRNKWMTEKEKIRIKREFLEMCDRFTNYLKSLNHEDYTNYQRTIEHCKIEQNREEWNKFRSRKIHKRD